MLIRFELRSRHINDDGIDVTILHDHIWKSGDDYRGADDDRGIDNCSRRR